MDVIDWLIICSSFWSIDWLIDWLIDVQFSGFRAINMDSMGPEITIDNNTSEGSEADEKETYSEVELATNTVLDGEHYNNDL